MPVVMRGSVDGTHRGERFTVCAEELVPDSEADQDLHAQQEPDMAVPDTAGSLATLCAADFAAWPQQARKHGGAHLDLALFTEQPRSKKHARRLAIRGKRTMRAVGPNFDPAAIAQLLQHLCADAHADNPQRIRLVASTAPKQAQCKEVIAWAGQAAHACGLHGSLVTSRNKPAGLFLEVERRGAAAPVTEAVAQRLQHMVQAALQGAAIHKHAHAAPSEQKCRQRQQVAAQLKLKAPSGLASEADGGVSTAFVSAGFINNGQHAQASLSAPAGAASTQGPAWLHASAQAAAADNAAGPGDAPQQGHLSDGNATPHANNIAEGDNAVLFDAWAGPALAAPKLPETLPQSLSQHAPICTVTNTVAMAAAEGSRGKPPARSGAADEAQCSAHGVHRTTCKAPLSAVHGTTVPAHSAAPFKNGEAEPARPASADAHAMSALAIDPLQQQQNAAHRRPLSEGQRRPASGGQLPACHTAGAPVHPQELVSLLSGSDCEQDHAARPGVALESSAAGAGDASASDDDVQIVGHMPASTVAQKLVDIDADMSPGLGMLRSAVQTAKQQHNQHQPRSFLLTKAEADVRRMTHCV